jgi:hypothetical protein
MWQYLFLHTVVLTQFDSNPSDPKTLLNLVGRPAGILGWLLSAMGLGSTTTMSITKDLVFIHRASMNPLRQTIPVHSIASTHCGYSMNFMWIIAAAVVLIWGLIGAIATAVGGREPGMALLIVFFTILFTALFVLAFFLSKCLLIGVETSGGTLLGVRFKKGVIDGASIGVEQLTDVIARLNHQLEKSSPGASASGAPKKAGPSERRDQQAGEFVASESVATKKAEQWYFARNGQRMGPYSPAELKQLVQSGQLSASDMLWKEGMPRWELVSKFKWE